MQEKTTSNVSKFEIPDIEKPLGRILSLRLATLITIITIIAGIASYFYTMSYIKDLVSEQLIKYAGERGLRESALFIESDEYQLRFQAEYVERYNRMGDQDPTGWFDEHMEKRHEDGSYRSKPELYYGKDQALGRRDHSASMMIGADTEITPEVIKALAIGYDMVNQYGPSWRKPFDDLYFSSPEKTSVSRWPGTPWGLMMDDEVDWREEEWMAITMVEQNPDRSQRWSGVLYDERNGNWMVSGVTPLDIDGKQVGMVGTDLLLDDLVNRTNNENLSGTYNVLLQSDGRVIAHPYKIDEIVAHKGKLYAQNSEEEHLTHLYDIARSLKEFPQVIDDKDDKYLVAITQIQGPDWYFITVYPQSLIVEKAWRNVGFILISGISTLIAMYLVLWLVLKRNLIYPLGILTQSVRKFKVPHEQWSNQTNEFSNGTSDLIVRHDEIGLLAGSFVDMVDYIKETYYKLDENMKDLELKISARTVDLQEAKNAAEAANRAKSIFLANMSHELRTPLNAILGFSQIICKDPETPELYRDDVDIIHRSAEHLLRLIDNVLDLAKIEAGFISLEEENFDLMELVNELLDLMSNRAESKNLQLTMDQSSTFTRHINADASKIRQILINLIGNAIKCTETGSIIVRINETPHSENDQIRIVFEIEDTGTGISESDRDRIFKPFEQALQLVDTKGTGLGLAISKQYVELMGGEIRLESELEKGSIFSFDITVQKLSDQEILNSTSSRGSVIGLEPTESDYRILVVEDQLESRLLLKRLLGNVGFSTREAINGEEAVKIFKEWNPQFIWMDWRMPVMDGLSATLQIRNLEGGKETIIVALTASVFKEQREQIIAAGTDDLVRKPFKENQILDTMAKYLGVKYQYSDMEVLEELTQDAGFHLTSDDIVDLNHNLLDDLRKAAMSGNKDLCLEIIESFDSDNSQSALALKTLVNEYRYDTIVELMSETLEN